MSMINILFIIIYGLLMPFTVGQIWSRKSEEHACTIAFPMICGVVTMFALFEILAVPMILIQQSFHVLYLSWVIGMWVITVVSAIWNYKNIIQTVQMTFERLKKITGKEWFVWAVAIFLILFQTWLLAGNMHTDTDDARFVAEAMEAYEKDTMLQYHPLTGEFLGHPIGEMNKDVQAPFPFFYALLGKLFQMIPTIAAHVVLPMLLIPLAYLVYYLIGRYLLKGNRLYTGLFLGFLSLIHLFAFESIYAAGYTLLAIAWQGRSVLAMIILPFIWYLLMRVTSDNQREEAKRYCLLLCCAVIAACLTSSMSAIMVPILTAAYMVVNVIKRRSLMPLVWMFILWIPSIFSFILFRVI